MTLNELVDIYKKIYGDNNVVYYNDSRTWELCPDLIYSLDYDDNDFRNMVAITQNDSGELFLSSNNEDIMAFDTMKQYEIEPVKNNVIKKYGLEVDNYTIVKKL